jgi:hypothetical protein
VLWSSERTRPHESRVEGESKFETEKKSKGKIMRAKDEQEAAEEAVKKGKEMKAELMKKDS